MLENRNASRRAGREPIFNAPPAVSIMVGLLVLVHLLRLPLSDESDWALVLRWSVVPSRYSAFFHDPLSASFADWVGLVLPLFSHTFLHGSLIHLGFNALWLLALGTPVVGRLGTRHFLIFYLLCGVVGSLAYVALHPESNVPMIGASGSISGLMGAVVRFALIPVRGGGLAPLADTRLLGFVFIWFVINFVMGLTGIGTTGEAQAIAWEAHMGGFITGLLLLSVFDRARRTAPPIDRTLPSGYDGDRDSKGERHD